MYVQNLSMHTVLWHQNVSQQEILNTFDEQEITTEAEQCWSFILECCRFCISFIAHLLVLGITTEGKKKMYLAVKYPQPITFHLHLEISHEHVGFGCILCTSSLSALLLLEKIFGGFVELASFDQDYMGNQDPREDQSWRIFQKCWF